jgi:hypothetical protein
MVDVDRDGKLGGRAVADADFQGDSPPTFETAAHNRPSVPVTVLTPAAAYDRIVAQAGVCPKRDAVDQRLITQLRSLGTSGAIVGGSDGEAAVGGQPTATQSQRPAGFDTDGDGMPDVWETAHGLNPSSVADATTDYTGDGYTNIEKYLNELASNACAGTPPTQPDAGADGRPTDAVAGADSARLDATDTASRDTATMADAADAGAPASDTAPEPSRDAAAAPDTSSSSPDSTTTVRDTADVLPEVSNSSDTATGAADTRPVPDTASAPDTLAPGPDAARTPDAAVPGPDAAPDSGTGSQNQDAGKVATAAASGCACGLGSSHDSHGLPWLLLGLAWLNSVRKAKRSRRSPTPADGRVDMAMEWIRLSAQHTGENLPRLARSLLHFEPRRDRRLSASMNAVEPEIDDRGRKQGHELR